MTFDGKVRVAMPLGVDANNDFSVFANVFQLITPYGLSAASGTQTEPQLSEALVLRIAAADPAPILHAVCGGALSYAPGAGTQPGSLKLQPLFKEIDLSRTMPGSGFPKAFIYDNVAPASVAAMAPDLLKDQPKDKRDQAQAEFLAGTRAISVACGAAIGRADTKNAPAGFRLLKLSAINGENMQVNPAHYLYRFHEIDSTLTAHPLLTTLKNAQTELRFSFKRGGVKRYVAKGSTGGDGQFLTPSTASSSIQSAISAAQDGDVVVVLDQSTYTESLAVTTKKTVTLISTAALSLQTTPSASANLPKLKAANTRVLRIVAGTVGVIGFKIEGAIVNLGYGGGVLIESVADTEIAYNVIESNTASQGGGIAVRTSSRVLITSNLIDKNDATGAESAVGFKGKGGAVCITRCRSVRLSGNVIPTNIAGNFGGGIAVELSNRILIADNTIGDKAAQKGNEVSGDSPDFSEFIDAANPRGGGGGIGVNRSNVSIIGNHIHYNKASRGGGIEMYGLSDGVIRNNWIENNQARPSIDELGGDGGGIAVNPISTTLPEVLATNTVLISGNKIAWNLAGDDGGGVYGTTRCVLALSNNDIHHNVALQNGGGIRVTFGAILVLNQGSLTQNSCNAVHEKGGGGGFSMFNANASLTKCRIEGNEATQFGGGGVYAMASDYSDFKSSIATLWGKSFEQLLEKFGLTQVSLTLTDCDIPQANGSANKATAGGGIYVVYRYYPFHLVLKNTYLGGNVSTHTDAAKKHDVVIENTTTSAVVNSANETLLANLQPVVLFDRTFLP